MAILVRLAIFLAIGYLVLLAWRKLFREIWVESGWWGVVKAIGLFIFAILVLMLTLGQE